MVRDPALGRRNHAARREHRSGHHDAPRLTAVSLDGVDIYGAGRIDPLAAAQAAARKRLRR